LHRKGLVIGILILMLGVNIGSTFAGDVDVKTMSPVSFDGDTLYVGGTGPNNYTTIQSAIDDAENGDTVFVYNGTYYENVVIDKTINLIGEDKDNTIIDGGGNSDVVRIIVNGCTLCNFSITGSGISPYDYGIKITSYDNFVSYNYLLMNANSIKVDSFNNQIINNEINDSTRGIRLESLSHSNLIENNFISNNVQGLIVFNSRFNTITKNIIFSNVLDGISLSEGSSNNLIADNNIVSNGQNGINLVGSCDNNIIKENDIKNTNSTGIYLDSSQYNIISNNNITNGNRYGVLMVGSAANNNLVCGNNIQNCSEYGIGIQQCDSNIIYHNNLINNVQNADDRGNNIWDNGYPSGGNYWDDYNGIDNNWGENQNINGSDGIGDTPFNISGGSNRDMYPLIEPYGMTRLTFSRISAGLFKFLITIKNIGNKTAFNVQWNITFDGGFILRGRHSSGTLPKPLLPGEEMSISSNLVFGFGRILINITAWADNAPVISITSPGFLLLFFVIPFIVIPIPQIFV